jgi:hypothetical protein
MGQRATVQARDVFQPVQGFVRGSSPVGPLGSNTGGTAHFHIDPDIATVRDAAEADAILAFPYAVRLRSLMLGPVIEIGGTGGDLSQFRKAQK